MHNGGLMRRGILATAIAFALFGGACTGDGPVYTSQDLEGLVTRPDEVPEGLVYARNLSGLASLEEFRGDVAGRTAMRDAGFQAAYTALIATPELLAFFTLSEPREKPPANGKLVSSAAVLFEDDEGAVAALGFFEDDLRSQFENPREIPAPGLGDVAFGMEGTQAGGRPAVGYAWQVGPLYEAVLGQGELDRDVLLELARTMYQRASADA